MQSAREPAMRLKGAALVATAAGLWSTTGVVARFAFTEQALPPLVLAWVRLVLAAPLFLLALTWLQGWRHVLPERRAWPFLAALGLAQAAYQALYLSAVSVAGAGLATLVSLCFAPVMTAVLASLFLGERLTRRTAEGMIGAITGTVLVVVFGETVVAGRTLWLGIALALASGLVYAGFTLLSGRAGTYCHPFQSACFGFAFGALLLLPLALWQIEAAAGLALEPAALAVVAYIVLVPTFIGYIAFFQGMRVTSATLSSIIVTLEPMAAAVLAWAVLGERLGVGGTAGALLLTAAVLWVVLERQHDNPAQ